MADLESDQYRMIKESLYMNRYLWKLGTEEAVYYRELKQVFINCVVQEYLNDIKQHVSKVFPGCGVKSVGSFKDGSQVGIPHEFDILFEIPDLMSLVKADQSQYRLHIIPVDIPPTGPQSRHMKTRTYVHVYATNTYDEELTSASPWGQFGHGSKNSLLDPGKLQTVFKTCIVQTLMNHPKRMSRPFEIKLKGPAVCLFLDIQSTDILEYARNYSPDSVKMLTSLGRKICIKIDLVLSISLKVLSATNLCIGNREESWTIGDASLTENSSEIKKCHLVVSGTYFHVSFCLHEAYTISQHITQQNEEGEVKAACLRSIKVIKVNNFF